MSDEPPSEIADDGEIPSPDVGWLNHVDWSSDPLAQFEESKPPIEQLLNEQIVRNQLSLHKHIGGITAIAMYLLSLLVAVALIILAFHYFLPQKCGAGIALCGWLSQDQLQHLQSVVFSGTLGAVVSGVVRHNFGSKRQ